jgi:hypothetical protein
MGRIRNAYNKTINQKNTLSKTKSTKQKKVDINNTQAISIFSDENWLQAYTIENTSGSYNNSVVY